MFAWQADGSYFGLNGSGCGRNGSLLCASGSGVTGDGKPVIGALGDAPAPVRIHFANASRSVSLKLDGVPLPNFGAALGGLAISHCFICLSRSNWSSDGLNFGGDESALLQSDLSQSAISVCAWGENDVFHPG